MSNYYAVTYSNSLSHHGIKGQKWGQRRYQNEDGSLTDAGRQRYGIVNANRLWRSKAAGAKAWRHEQKFKSSRTKFMKRYHANEAARLRYKSERLKNKINAKTLKEKVSARIGAKENETHARIVGEYNKRMASTYKEGSKKQIRQLRSAENAKALAKSWKNLDEGNASVRDVLNTPLTKLSNGKQTTYGKEIAKAVAISVAAQVDVNTIQKKVLGG